MLLKNFKSLKSQIKGASIKQILNLIEQIIKHSSASQITKLLFLLEVIALGKNLKLTVRSVKNDFQKKGPWYGMMKKLFTKINFNCRKKFIDNLVIKAGFQAESIRNEFAKKEGFRPPWFFVISPSMTCNLRCIGCYAGEYSKKDNLPFKVYDRVIKEGKEMGCYFYTISGGEPFYNEDNLRIFKKHNDCYFLVYTNGTLINKKMAKRIAKLGNIAPAISVEGFKKETDFRRGKGVWDKVMQAMKNLKEEGVIFGFSATPTALNTDILASEKFIDFFIKKGCLFGWYFQYIPIGRDPNINLMAAPEQRDKLRKFVHKKVRKEKPIFIGDFWNDGPYVGGCMAGGSLYFHINVHGDVEPCVFAHFAVDNVKKKSLKNCLKSNFFKILRDRVQSYRAPHRYSDNLLTPCMIIDNPWVLRECVKKGNAHPTHKDAETIIKHPKIVKHLDQYSKRLHQIKLSGMWRKINMKNIPNHIGIIIDGNRRWAKKKNLPSLVGHKKGIDNVKTIILYAQKLDIKIITVYGFSTENWNRSKHEIDYLMKLFEKFIDKNIQKFHKTGIQLRHLGNLKKLPLSLQKKIHQAIQLTKNNKKMIFQIALNYGGRDEIKRLIQKIIREGIKSEDINEEYISKNLDTKGLPDPDLIIRTSGEQRLSGFLLWQVSYSELYFPKIYWPDFDKNELNKAISEYQLRKRRFGR